MRRLWLTLILVFLPTLVCKADMPSFNDTPNQQIPSNLLKQNNLQNKQNPDELEIHYGFSSLKFHNGPVQTVKIDHTAQTKSGDLFHLMPTAEAADVSIKELEHICNSVNGANRLEDLTEVLSHNNFQLLQEKVNSGKSPYIVLAMVQAMRPSHIEILDFNLQDNNAQLAVRGRSTFGITQGLIGLVKEDNLWKINRENWQAGGSSSMGFISATVNPLSKTNQYAQSNSSGLISQISPDYKVNRNFLALTRVPYNKSRRAFTFVFLIKNNKSKLGHAKEVYDSSSKTFVKENPRAKMHVLWTGSRKLMPEQKVVDYQTPIGFSIANYDDGYSPGQWNLILPNKKPREVTVSFLMNF